jgi:hypothetical protein
VDRTKRCPGAARARAENTAFSAFDGVASLMNANRSVLISRPAFKSPAMAQRAREPPTLMRLALIAARSAAVMLVSALTPRQSARRCQSPLFIAARVISTRRRAHSLHCSMLNPSGTEGDRGSGSDLPVCGTAAVAGARHRPRNHACNAA